MGEGDNLKVKNKTERDPKGPPPKHRGGGGRFTFKKGSIFKVQANDTDRKGGFPTSAGLQTRRQET